MEGKYGKVSAEAGLGVVKGEARIGIPEGFSIGSDKAKTAGLALAASAMAAGAGAEGYLGLEDMNVHGKAEGSLVGAGAEAKAGLTAGDGKVSLGVNAEAEAYLAKGEVSGGITFLGIDIDLELEGMVGVQAEAEAAIGLTEIKAGVGLGPIGVDIAIDWSDFDLTFRD
ncbi:MAG: hypothetical protein IJP31_11690 [Lachnospiraceae bacterium]|nr:hypothetical protein [Lachnospiraceae bacterium]